MPKFPLEYHTAVFAAAAAAVLESAFVVEDMISPPWCPGDLHTSQVLFGIGLQPRLGGRIRLLHAFAIGPLTTHPVREGAPFLILAETSPTFGCSQYVSSIPVYYTQFFDVYVLYLSSVAECGRHPSPRIAVIFLATV